MEGLIEIAKMNWKQNLRYHAAAALLFCTLTPVFFDVHGLDEISMAKILEFYLILLGVICLVPVFLPDQDIAVRELLDAKRTSVYTVCAVRLAQSMLLLGLLSAGTLLYLRHEGCSFSFLPCFAGTVAGMIFLGGMGMAVLALSNWMPLAYMMPLLYYVLNMGSGKKYLGNWYLNSMCLGSFAEKWYLFFTGAVLIALSFWLRKYAGKSAWRVSVRNRERRQAEKGQSLKSKTGIGG